MLTNRCRAALPAMLLALATACGGDGAASGAIRITDVEISNAVALVEKPDGTMTERKDPNIQTIYFDLEARGTGAWESRCAYTLLAENGEVVDHGHFQLSGSEGELVNVAAPFTFDVRDLPARPSDARVECPNV